MKSYILIIEDDEAIREAVESILVEEGVEVRTAENGRDGLEVLKSQPEDRPNLILLDLMMPVMDGNEFLDHMRKEETWKSIPVAVFTAATGMTRPATANEFLKKPLQIDDLLSLVGKYCA